ncbi:sensor histidine kinase [Paramagnetospirillum magnetotacticum]|uniref:sensor histidine kinase n=1 Tax=Paramagnetospirillum magnetotacticum TaxID=188 RepID=UPI0000384A17|nr:ATP-binding protein [Paramagnetospirillum magnetotacticum]
MGGLIVVFLAALVGSTLFSVISSRSEELRDADNELRHTSHLLAEVAASTFLSIDKVLMGTAEIAARQDDPSRLLQFLRRQLAQAPTARALLVIGPDGMSRLATNLPDPHRAIDLSDRPYFLHHRNGGPSTLYVSGVIQSRNDDHWIMVLSRRIETPDGAFAGVVAATINLEQLASILDAAAPDSSDSALLVSPDGTILARSPDHVRYVGKSLAGQPAFETARTAPEGSGEILSPLDGRKRLYAFHKASSHPVIAVASHDQEAQLREWRLHSMTLVASALLVGLIIGALALFLARQLERMDRTLSELARSRREADAANRAKSAFLANMSHELRTPLNAIIGFSDALLVGIPGHTCQSRCQDYLGHVQTSSRHLLSLINDILDLSKIEAGSTEIALAPTPLALLITECLEIVRAKAESKNISVALAGPDQDLMVTTDSRRLRQIVLNLLSNAVKFTPEGGRIILEAECDSGQLALTVNDTGIGMTQEEIAVALTPFGQNDSDLARREAGTGLGLPLSKRLTELLGGTLSVTSIPGRGTTVTISLPLSRPLP